MKTQVLSLNFYKIPYERASYSSLRLGKIIDFSFSNYI